jgi:hypothetical protein
VQDARHPVRVDALDLRLLAQPVARPLQALVDGLLALEQAKRDLLGAEPAQRLQRQDQLRLGRDRGIGADEKQPKHVVLHLLLRVFALDLGEVALVPLAAAELVEHVVVGDPVQPRAGIVRQTRRPGLRRPQQGGLGGVLAQLQALHAEPPGQNGDQAPELVSEPVVRELGRAHVRTA